MWTRGKYLVGVLCSDESVCKGIQAQIQLGGSPKDRDSKNQNLELAMQLRQRSQWWSYAPASIIVVEGVSPEDFEEVEPGGYLAGLGTPVGGPLASALCNLVSPTVTVTRPGLGLGDVGE